MVKWQLRQNLLLFGALATAVLCGILAEVMVGIPMLTILSSIGAGVLAYLTIDYALAHASPRKPQMAKRRDGLYRKICPHCGGLDISSYSPPGYLLGRRLADRCHDCGYGDPQGKVWTKSVVFPEVTQSGLLHFRDGIKHKKRS